MTTLSGYPCSSCNAWVQTEFHRCWSPPQGATADEIRRIVREEIQKALKEPWKPPARSPYDLITVWKRPR